MIAELALATVGMVAAISGVLKLLDVDAVRPALDVVGLPDTRGAVRLLGAVEVTLGAGAVLVGGVVFAGLLALLYAGLTVVAWLLVRSGADVPCGCVGRSSAPASWLHVAVNVIATVLAAGAGVAGAGGLYSADELGFAEVGLLAVATLVAVGVVVLLGGRPRQRSALSLEPTAMDRHGAE